MLTCREQAQSAVEKLTIPGSLTRDRIEIIKPLFQSLKLLLQFLKMLWQLL
jgi:hypothetical protein